MKKKLLIFMWLLVTMITTIFTSCGNTCSKFSDTEWTKKDSDVVKSIVNDVTVTKFTSYDEILTYQTYLLDNEEEKVIFLSMKPETLKHVATVVFSKQNLNEITISDIIQEYLRGQDIYDRLNINNTTDISDNLTPIQEITTTPGVTSDTTSTKPLKK